MKETIGFIGQGYVGTAYAKNYESRGYSVIRYEKGTSYRECKSQLATCDIIFVAVPTPTTPQGFNAGIVRETMKLIKPGTIVVIKSTVLPGMTEAIQEENPDLFIVFSPEFLSVVTADRDVSYPPRNIIGIPKDTEEYRHHAARVMNTLPTAPFTQICTAREAELIKYGKNTLGFIRILHTNILYELAEKHGASWEAIKAAMAVDPEIPGDRYLSPVHQGGRGAGGECFIKDFEAFRSEYIDSTHDAYGAAFLTAARNKNIALLRETKKDSKIIKAVYGRTDLPL